jgi:hypothetical protein
VDRQPARVPRCVPGHDLLFPNLYPVVAVPSRSSGLTRYVRRRRRRVWTADTDDDTTPSASVRARLRNRIRRPVSVNLSAPMALTPGGRRWRHQTDELLPAIPAATTATATADRRPGAAHLLRRRPAIRTPRQQRLASDLAASNTRTSRLNSFLSPSGGRLVQQVQPSAGRRRRHVIDSAARQTSRRHH